MSSQILGGVKQTQPISQESFLTVINRCGDIPFNQLQESSVGWIDCLIDDNGCSSAAPAIKVKSQRTYTCVSRQKRITSLTPCVTGVRKTWTIRKKDIYWTLQSVQSWTVFLFAMLPTQMVRWNPFGCWAHLDVAICSFPIRIKKLLQNSWEESMFHLFSESVPIQYIDAKVCSSSAS